LLILEVESVSRWYVRSSQKASLAFGGSPPIVVVELSALALRIQEVSGFDPGWDS
jgi:hypothetical protein